MGVQGVAIDAEGYVGTVASVELEDAAEAPEHKRDSGERGHERESKSKSEREREREVPTDVNDRGDLCD